MGSGVIQAVVADSNTPHSDIAAGSGIFATCEDRSTPPSIPISLGQDRQARRVGRRTFHRDFAFGRLRDR